MVLIQFKLGNPKSPLSVTIQEEDAAEAFEQLRTIEAEWNEKEGGESNSGEKPPWFSPPTIN